MTHTPRLLALLVMGIWCAASIAVQPTPVQPTFWSLEIQDDPPLDLPPLGKDLAPSGTVFVTRAALSPAARERLAAGLGYEHVSTLDPTRMGPAVFTRKRPGVIPGDPRLRIEEDDVTVSVLGLGATIEETLQAARAEPMPSCILIGAHADAKAPHPWVRYGEPALRPVLWIRAVSAHVERVEGSMRILTIMDGPGPVGPSLERLRELSNIPIQSPFPHALQGIATDDEGAVYWSWMDKLVKSNSKGEVLVTVAAPSPLGDLMWHDGRIFAAAASHALEVPGSERGQVVHVFDARTLEAIARHRLSEARGGLGGVCWAGDRYVVTSPSNGALDSDAGATEVVHEYDAEFHWVRSVPLPMRVPAGIRTAEYAYGRFFFGCGGATPCVLVAAPDLSTVVRLDPQYATHGIAEALDGRLLIGWSQSHAGAFRGGVRVLYPSFLWH